LKVSIIISTYNAEEWLQKVLVGYSVQTEQDFEIVIADDGSTPLTKETIDQFNSKFKHKIIHVWQEDNGFQKTKIINKAILNSNSEYLIFTDGDCIPRNDFIANHLKNKEIGYFLSGGYFKLPMIISKLISVNDIIKQNCFRILWLKKQGLKFNFKITKLTQIKCLALFLNWITPTKKSWNGHNSSAFKSDIVAINGFNHDMQYGGLDREMGERLFNNGLFSKQIRFSAICLHLDHKRGYASPETWKINNDIRTFNKKYKVTYISNGLDKITEL
jgi:glycosyltransferase involved in cell wall biosynthesis